MIDPRKVFLGRAAARHELYVAEAMTLDDAFGGSIPAFAEIMGLADLRIRRRLACSSPGIFREFVPRRGQAPSTGAAMTPEENRRLD